MGTVQGRRHGVHDRTSGRTLVPFYIIAAILVLTWAVPPWANAQQSATASLVFDGVTVVDVEQGELVPAQRVVIAGNRIQAVGDMETVKMPDEAQVVDARGKYLIPGLWDLHVHALGDVPYRFYIANGVTGFRSGAANGRIFSSGLPLDSLVWWRDAALAGRRVAPPRQIFGMRFSLRELNDDTLMASLKARGLNAIKIYHYNRAAVAAARRTGLPFGGHLSMTLYGVTLNERVPKISPLEASDSGHTIIDHWPVAMHRRCSNPRQASLESCQEVAERFRRNNTWMVPTFLRIRRTIPQSEASALVMTRLEEVSTRLHSGMSPPQGNWLRDAMVSDDTTAPDRALSLAQQVGLPILAGTDQHSWRGFGKSNMRLFPGLSLHAELAIYVAEGLTPLAALQAATLNPAKMLRGTDSLGTVAPGKLADLVLLDADPLADITNTTMVRAVAANGRYFGRAALDSLLADARATGP